MVVLLEEHPLEHLGALEASSGTSSVPSAKYQRIASDSARWRPSSNWIVGTRSAGLAARPIASSRFERSTTLSSIRSKGMPSRLRISRTL